VLVSSVSGVTIVVIACNSRRPSAGLLRRADGADRAIELAGIER
jgi:hypothetical protein